MKRPKTSSAKITKPAKNLFDENEDCYSKMTTSDDEAPAFPSDHGDQGEVIYDEMFGKYTRYSAGVVERS